MVIKSSFLSVVASIIYSPLSFFLNFNLFIYLRNSRKLENNRIAVIESGAFNGVTVTWNIQLSNNLMKTIEPNAFNNVLSNHM